MPGPVLSSALADHAGSLAAALAFYDTARWVCDTLQMEPVVGADAGCVLMSGPDVGCVLTHAGVDNGYCTWTAYRTACAERGLAPSPPRELYVRVRRPGWACASTVVPMWACPPALGEVQRGDLCRFLAVLRVAVDLAFDAAAREWQEWLDDP